MLWEKLVDTPVRGVVLEGAGPRPRAGARARPRGRAARRTRRGGSRSRCSTPHPPTTSAGGPPPAPRSRACSAVEPSRLIGIPRWIPTRSSSPSRSRTAPAARSSAPAASSTWPRRASCAPRWSSRRAGAVTLDLAALQFLDTSGLRLILETAEAARRDGFAFTVLPGIPAVQRLFDVAGVTELRPVRRPTEARPDHRRPARRTRRAGSRRSRPRASSPTARAPLDEVVAAAARPLVPALADVCLLHWEDGGVPRLVGVRVAGPDGPALEARIRALDAQSPGGRWHEAPLLRPTCPARTSRRSAASTRSRRPPRRCAARARHRGADARRAQPRGVFDAQRPALPAGARRAARRRARQRAPAGRRAPARGARAAAWRTP